MCSDLRQYEQALAGNWVTEAPSHHDRLGKFGGWNHNDTYRRCYNMNGRRWMGDEHTDYNDGVPWRSTHRIDGWMHRWGCTAP